jgi:hypothetical protein
MTSRSWTSLFARTARTPARWRLLLEALEDRSCPSVFYDFNPIATTGSTVVGGQTLTVLGNNPSVNDNGAVAFTGTSSAGQGLYVGGTGTPVAVSSPSAEVNIGPQLSINNAGQIAATISNPSSPSQSVFLCDGASSPNTGRFVAFASPVGSLGTAVAANNSGDVVYTSKANGVTSLNYYRTQYGSSSTIASFQTAQTLYPSVSDTRSVVARILYSSPEGELNSQRIVLFTPRADGTYSTTIIASWAVGGFTSLGAQPGISADGSIVVFAASKGSDQGIWASIAGDNSTRSLVRLTGGLVNGVNNPELGYDASGNPIYLKSFNLDQPVRVARQDLEPNEDSLDSFVVTFQATPSSASIANPTPGVTRPLLFTAQTGIWSERVDEDRETEAPHVLAWNPTSPLPVVQVGDLVGGKTVASLGGAAVANAATDITAPGNPTRIQRDGDHQVVFWAAAGDGTQMVVLGRHVCSSGDGLLDFWKTTGIDIDQDGTVDLKLSDWGATVGRRDLFLEIDWTTPRMYNGQVVWSDAPTAGATTALANMFAAAPAVGSGASTIPAGITLHVDAGSGNDSLDNPFSQNTGTGQLFGGQLIGMPNDPNGHPDVVYMGKPLPTNTFDGLQLRSLDEIKRTYLGPASEKDARELVFHFMVMADSLRFSETDAQVKSAGNDTLTSVGDLPEGESGVGRGTPIMITSGAGTGQVRFVTSVNYITKTMRFSQPWSTKPDGTSRFAVLAGVGGQGEADWRPGPNNSPFPGNDVLVTVGDFQFNPALLPSEWQVMAHELGHNLGLLHHGVNEKPENATNYKSLMSYAYAGEVGGTVKSYGTLTVKGKVVWNDWDNLRLDFQSAFKHLGNSFNISGLPETQ